MKKITLTFKGDTNNISLLKDVFESGKFFPKFNLHNAIEKENSLLITGSSDVTLNETFENADFEEIEKDIVLQILASKRFQKSVSLKAIEECLNVSN